MRIDGSTGIYDGIIHIINEDKGKTIYLTAHDDKTITLDDCLELIDYDDGTCIVIFDNWTHGEIYQYGNYGAFWTTYGTTPGFA